MCGKIHPSYKCLFIPFDGTENAKSKYEVLVNQKRLVKARKSGGKQGAEHYHISIKLNM